MAKKEAPMRYCRFMADGRAYSGVLRGSSVDIVEGDPFSGITSMIRLSFPVDRVKFLPPFLPKKLWCIGRNYVGHVKELDHDVPEEPMVFMKSTSAVTGANDFIRIPSWAGTIHYEGELAVVIGKGGKNIPENEAYEHVLGYTIMNDVTARALQNKDGQWTRSKSFDTFAPLGPAMLITKELPQDTRVVTRVNGRVVQDGSIGLMIFPIPRLISHISRFATLEEGDVISTGTPQGVGELHVGDVVEVEIEPIGMLRNICAE
ncbi:MAG: fumarylacetoacetate hydrolase family protein [Synergistes sp.]|nr:fumarylacetoacetate hydrolase family protein [Synergistes sp.]MCR5336758.1 fumarylacetoacetate hydrolase family protein [Synergistes sp.]